MTLPLRDQSCGGTVPHAHYVDCCVRVLVWACSHEEAEAEAPAVLRRDFADLAERFEYHSADHAQQEGDQP